MSAVRLTDRYNAMIVCEQFAYGTITRKKALRELQRRDFDALLAGRMLDALLVLLTRPSHNLSPSAFTDCAIAIISKQAAIAKATGAA